MDFILQISLWLLGSIIPVLRRQPKIRIEYHYGGYSRSGTVGQKTIFSWNGRIKIYNESGYDALRLGALESIPSDFNMCLKKALPVHLKSLDKFEMPVGISKELIWPSGVTNQEYERANYPEILKRFTFMLVYYNAHGKRFYSRLVYSEGKGTVSYHYIRPYFICYLLKKFRARVFN